MSTLRETLQGVIAAGKRVIIVGLGITGTESARLLVQHGAKVLVAEKRLKEHFCQKESALSELANVESVGAEVVFGVDGERLTPYLTDAGLVVLSPGVSLESSVVGTVTRLGIPYVSELELGVELHQGRCIVVTGSNGKSTTASLINQILKRDGRVSQLREDVRAQGIVKGGAPCKGTIEGATLIVEASSYQLEACTLLKPAISVILNISENHLERHGSLERYATAKGRALRLQTRDDLAVINADDPVVNEVTGSCRATMAVFGVKPPEALAKLAKRWAHIGSGRGASETISLSIDGSVEEYPMHGVRLTGLHNRYNIAAAIIVARHIGVPQNVVQEGLETFAPLEHRLEIVWRDDTRAVINDSKSTTVAASLAAISTMHEQFPNQPIALMIGGLSKACSWSPLLSKIANKGLCGGLVICFGADAALLASHCRAACVPHTVASTLRDATREALTRVSSGGVILLSPGSSSFDEFVDFEQRGAEFKRYLREDGVEIFGTSV